MKKIIFFGLMFGFLSLSSQVFTFTASSTKMVGVPGNAFYYHIGFYNPTASSITIQFDRYTKYNPPYWYSCFCFISCNPPSVDYVDIEVPPFSWGPQMSVLFKTDSVNPGQATASIKFNQQGFQSTADTVHLVATTAIETGIPENNISPRATSYPNPSTDKATIARVISEEYYLSLTDPEGKILMPGVMIDQDRYELDMGSLPKGIYFCSLRYSSGKTEWRKLVKN